MLSKGGRGGLNGPRQIDHPHTPSPSPSAQKPRIKRIIVPTAPGGKSAAAAQENGVEGGVIASDGSRQGEGPIAPIEAPPSSHTVTEAISIPYCHSFVF